MSTTATRVHYEYLSVREVAGELQKGKTRMYEMIEEGLLEEIGWVVLRIKGRIWVGVPRCGPGIVLDDGS